MAGYLLVMIIVIINITIKLIVKKVLLLFSQFLFQPFIHILSLSKALFLNNTELKERLCVKQAVLGSIPGGNQIF